MIDLETALAALNQKAAQNGKTWLPVSDIEAVLRAQPAQGATVSGLDAQGWFSMARRLWMGLGAIAHTDDKAATVAQQRAIARFYRGEGPLVEHVVRNPDGTLTVVRPGPDDPAPPPPRRMPLTDAAPGNP